MRRVIALARSAERSMRPNPRVAALVVLDGKIVGRGVHRRAGGAHAEVIALEQAGADARGAVMYVNLEPCNHFGNTPPCTEAIVQAGIARVVTAMRDPNPRVRGGGIECLQGAGVEVQVGILESPAANLNRTWLTWLEKGRAREEIFEISERQLAEFRDRGLRRGEFHRLQRWMRREFDVICAPPDLEPFWQPGETQADPDEIQSVLQVKLINEESAAVQTREAGGCLAESLRR